MGLLLGMKLLVKVLAYYAVGGGKVVSGTKSAYS
jgi:hypothetical protein